MRKILFFLLSLVFFPEKISSQNCDQLSGTKIFFEDYSDSSGWTFSSLSGGIVSINNGTFNFNAAQGGNYNIACKNLPFTLSKEYWKAECIFTPLFGNSPGHYVMALTAGSLDPISLGPPSYSTTNQDGILIYLIYPYGPTSPSCCTNPNNGPWQIVARAKRGNNLYPPSSGIPVTSLFVSSYVRFELLNNSVGTLGVYSDPQFSIHLPGSPVYLCIDTTISGLNTIQHGVVTWGWYYRELTAAIDSLVIQTKNEIICDSLNYFCDTTSQAISLSLPEIDSATYSWWPSTGLSCANCSDPLAAMPLPGQSASYFYSINSDCGVITGKTVIKNSVCADSVSSDSCFYVHCPNIFTPNEDGINDALSISHCGTKKFSLRIYDRWGRLVFESGEISRAWDGRNLAGNSCSEGVYYYQIEADYGFSSSQNTFGYLLLVR